MSASLEADSLANLALDSSASLAMSHDRHRPQVIADKPTTTYIHTYILHATYSYK
jgi:hypothetical protein